LAIGFLIFAESLSGFPPDPPDGAAGGGREATPAWPKDGVWLPIGFRIFSESLTGFAAWPDEAAGAGREATPA
jgi:hypothetical protein